MLLMAIVMMAMSPQPLWAVNDDELDEECPHDGDTFWEPNGDGTHSKMCFDCGEGVGPYNEKCVDENEDGYCDKCDYCVCKHDGDTYWVTNGDGTHGKKCSLCNESLWLYEDCADEDMNGICDVCDGCLHKGSRRYEGLAGDGFHNILCGVCGFTLDEEDCTDDDENDYCDVCGASMYAEEPGDEDEEGEEDEPIIVGDVIVLASTGGFSNEGAEKLFDNNESTKWCSRNESECNFYVIFKYGAAKTITGYSLVDGGDTEDFPERHWAGWTLYGANFSADNIAKSDTATWNVVDARKNHEYGGNMSFTIADTAAYQYYKLVVTQLDMTEDEEGYTFYLQQMADINFTFAGGTSEGGDEPSETCQHENLNNWLSYSDGTHQNYCKVCNSFVGELEDCTDNNNDYNCDKCGYCVCPHNDRYYCYYNNATHEVRCSICDQCADDDEDCADENEDGKCDKCGHAMSGNTSGGGDEPGEEPGEANYPELDLGESTIDIKSSGDADNGDGCTLFAFVATQSGSLTITTSGNEDTYGYLYDASMTLLACNDDSGEDSNFQIIYEVEADSTYYIGVKEYSGNAIEGYTIKLLITEQTRNVAILASTGGFEDEGAENLFDNDADTKWCSRNESECNFYVIFKYGAAETITGYSLVDGDDTGDEQNRHWKGWTLYGANFSSDDAALSDTATWNEVDVRTDHSYGDDMSFEIANTAAYQYYKLVVTDLNPYYDEDESLYYLQQMADINFTFADGGDEPGDEYPALSLNDNTVNCNVYDEGLYLSPLYTFTPEEDGNYAFTFEEGNVEIFSSEYCNGYAENPLIANTTYYIRLWANEAVTDGTLTITYEGSGDEYPALSLNENKISCTQPDEEGELYLSPLYTFTPEEDGNYAFTFEEGDVEIYTSKYCNGYAENPLSANTTYYIRLWANEAVTDGTLTITYEGSGDEPGDEYPALSLNENTVSCNVYDWQVGVYFSCLFSFTPEENGNYAFTFAGGDAEIFTSFYCNQSAENPLSANTTYYIRLGANEAITDGTLTITYEGSGDEYPALSLNENTVSCTEVTVMGDYLSIYTFTPEEDGNYTFTFEGDVMIYTSDERNEIALNPLTGGSTYYLELYSDTEVTDGTLTITKEGGDEYPALSLNENTVNCNEYDEPSGVYVSYLYSFTPEEDGNYAFTLAGGGVDIFTSFYCDESTDNPLTGGTTYYIRLWANEAITDGTLTITYEGSGDEYPVLALGENTGISVSDAGTVAISSEIFIFNTDCDGIYKFELADTTSYRGEAYIYANEDFLNPIGTTEVCLTGPDTYYVRLIGVGEETTVTLNISRVGAMDRNLYMVAKDDYFGDATSIVFTTHEALPASADSLTNLNDSETVCLYQDSDDETIFYIAPTVEKVAVLAPSDCSTLFLSLNKLESIDLSNFDTRNVTSMNDMFHMDTPEWDYEAEAYEESTISKLRNITFGEFFTTDNVKNMNGMFIFCSSLQSIDLSKFNTEEVRNMNDMFYNCTSLQSLDLSNFNTENVTNMNCMFQECRSLRSIELSSFNTENVTNMGGMFNVCRSLQSLDLSNFNTQKVENMNYMFSGCNSLQSLDLSSFNTENVTNMSYMFQECISLRSLELSSFNTEEVTDMSNMFCICESLRSLDLRNFNTEKVTDMNCMFNGCRSLLSLDLSSFNTKNVMYMTSMFQECLFLPSLDLSSFNTEKVTDMSSMFCDCESLQSLDLSSFNTEKVTDMSCMFQNCYRIKSIYASSGFVVGEDAYTEDMFINCEQLVGINGTTYSGDHTDGEYAYIDTDETPGYFSIILEYATYALNDGEAYTLRSKANVGTLTYTREIKESQVNKWQALYVPFQMSSDDWSSDYDVAAINNFHEYYDEDGKLSDRVLEIVKIKSGKTKANYPYLIRPKSAGTKTITLTDVELASAKENSISCSSTKTKYTFTGSYQTVENLAANGYVFLTGGALCTTSNAATTLKPQRWFLDVENYDTQWDAYTPAASDPADPTMQSSGIRIQVIGEEEATGIEEIQVKTTFGHNAAGNGAIYDIAGRRLNEATRGFNIVRSQDKVQKLFVK